MVGACTCRSLLALTPAKRQTVVALATGVHHQTQFPELNRHLNRWIPSAPTFSRWGPTWVQQYLLYFDSSTRKSHWKSFHSILFHHHVSFAFKHFADVNYNWILVYSNLCCINVSHAYRIFLTHSACCGQYWVHALKDASTMLQRLY